MNIEGSVAVAAGAKLYYSPSACSLAAHIVALRPISRSNW